MRWSEGVSECIFGERNRDTDTETVREGRNEMKGEKEMR